MSTVYLARSADGDHQLPAPYALKLLEGRWSSDPVAIECLCREAEVGHSVSHPHLVPILASHTQEPPYFVVMPRLDGSPLTDRLAESLRPSVPVALWIVRQVAEALGALHQAGWTHGDVKPGNILVSPRHHATLVDLGFAKRREEYTLSADRPVVGTVQYMAPELMVSRGRADLRSDIYSLGVTLYQLLAGKLPFGADDMQGFIQQHRQHRPPSLRLLNPLLPRELVRLVADMLAKQPLRRPQTPAELIERLTRLEIVTLSAR